VARGGRGPSDVDTTLKAIERGDVAPFYLLAGPQRYLQLQVIDSLRRALLRPAEEELNLHRFQGEDCLGQAVAAARVPPFLAEHRLCVVEDPVTFAPTRAGRGRRADTAAEDDDAPDRAVEGAAEETADLEGVKALEGYLRQPPPGACIALLSPAVDRRRAAYRRVAANGVVVACEAPSRPADVAAWVAREGRRRGLRLDQEAAYLLAEGWDGDDLGQLATELEKLTAYAGSETIAADDVRAVGAGGATGTIFDLVDALGERRPTEAIDRLRLLLRRGEPPLRVLAMLARQVRLILQARSMDRGPGPLAAELGLHPFVARKCVAQAGNFSIEELRHALVALHEADVAIKTGRREPAAALEDFIVDVACGRAARGAHQRRPSLQ